MKKRTAIFLVVAAWFVFDEPGAYRAEVGYYEGRSKQWYIGAPKSRGECTSEAIWKYNTLNAGEDGRAFSWACLYVVGDRVVSRHR